MGNIVDFYKTHGAIPIPRLILVAAISGLSGVLVLGTLNMGATFAAHGYPLGAMLVIFLVVQAIYTLSQRYLYRVSFVGSERTVHAYRMKQVERIRHCDLDTLEAIGPTLIYGALTRQAQVLYTSSVQIVIGLQSAIVIVFGLAYLGSVNIAALIVAGLVLGIGVAMYLGRLQRAHAGLSEASAKENELFGSLTDLLQGFKEVRLNLRRSSDLAAFIAAISQNVRDRRSIVNVKLMELFLFAQLTFFAACAALVFLLPPSGLMAPADLMKTVVAVLFLLGPVTGMTGAVPALANAQVACTALTDLEHRLEAAQRSRPTIERLGGFSEIKLDAVTYRHGNEDIGFTVGPLDLALRAGEILFVSGANGSGKSTLLRLLTALYAPQGGALLVDGRPVDDDHREAYQGLFSTVFSDFHLFERTFGLGEVAPALVDEWLERTELAGKTRLVDGRFDTIALSTGQRKRLALVVAALEDRPVCVFDEFAADQDVDFRRKFYDEILPLLHNRGKTVIAVTHDERYFDRATRHVTMEEGRWIQGGTAHV
jgi:putative pyoverdin transport system ATP-binding/permease protein